MKETATQFDAVEPRRVWMHQDNRGPALCVFCSIPRGRQIAFGFLPAIPAVEWITVAECRYLLGLSGSDMDPIIARGVTVRWGTGAYEKAAA